MFFSLHIFNHSLTHFVFVRMFEAHVFGLGWCNAPCMGMRLGWHAAEALAAGW